MHLYYAYSHRLSSSHREGTAEPAMNKSGVRFNLYVPEQLGARAKEADLPLSRIFQAALERELGVTPAPRADIRRAGRNVQITVPVETLRELLR
jgi:hypothetical protein